MKILKLISIVSGCILLVLAFIAVFSDSERLNSASVVLGLSSQLLMMSALAIHLAERKKAS